MLFSLLLSYVALFRNSFNEISLSEFNLVSQPLRYYTKYLIDIQHFYSDCYITDCGVTHAAVDPRARRPPLFVRTDKQAPIATFRAPAAAQGTPGLLSEQTSKRPRTKDFKPIATLPSPVVRTPWIPGKTPFCQNRQASTP